MIHDLKPYPAYKDSGEPWLGDVPVHWDVAPLRGIGHFSKGSGGTKSDDVAEGEPCIRYGDLYTQKDMFFLASRSFITPERAVDYTPLMNGDVLFAGSGETLDEIGKSAVCLIPGSVYCGGDVLILRPTREMNPRFLGYASNTPQSMRQKACMGRGVTIMHIYTGSLKYLRLAIPPLYEQAAIVRYLNYMDRRIQRYIRAKQEMIRLLGEQKQAIVHRFVMRGIDESVSLKPSGTPWLGHLPEHWTVSRSKHLFSVRKDLARPDDVQLSATQGYGVIPQAEYEAKVGRRVVKISMHLEKRRHVEKDDFVISMRSFQGGLERAWASGAIRSSYVVLQPGPSVDVEFFSYLLKSPDYIRALQSTADFIRDGQDLTFDNFCRVDLPLVPLEEQRAIATAITSAASGITSNIERVTNQLDLIREYRNRLIADVATGRLDVREIAASVPDAISQEEILLDGMESYAEDGLEDDDSGLEGSLEQVEV
jgi:type I restriction enzyme, S subunit